MRHHQTGRTLQQQRTSLPPAEVLAAAKEFFSRQSGSTAVSASSYMFDAQVALFLTGLPPAVDAVTGVVS